MGSVGLDGGCNNEIGQQNYFLKMFQLLQDSWSEMDSRQYLQILFFPYKSEFWCGLFV